jgi:hypothetical protein
MTTKTKITTAAALAALAAPAAALGHGGDDQRKGKGEARAKAGQEQRSDSKRRGDDDGRRGQHRGWHHGRRAFVVVGEDAKVAVADGKLTAPITLDPTAASKGAKRFLELTKAKLRSEETVEFGTAGDETKIRYVGLQSTDALQPTDRVLVKGKLRRERDEEKATATKTLDIKKIVVIRKSAERDDD